MPILPNNANPSSAEFQHNLSVMVDRVADLKTQLETIQAGGGEKANAKHIARGKLLPRERIEHLLDPNTPFLELSPLAGHELYPEKVAAGGIITQGLAPFMAKPA